MGAKVSHDCPDRCSPLRVYVTKQAEVECKIPQSAGDSEVKAIAICLGFYGRWDIDVSGKAGGTDCLPTQWDNQFTHNAHSRAVLASI